ncbi:TonB-dependent receptor [Parabacteroides sp. PF5-9]|uniref:SusC/RagA family TonB-linked outer membrane protein n=1 Tax=Parabacteroides sp. PF5-9 TaxID=1742404 RepID=UPI0024733017|nr:TonB-dependent receptor [Parabacteroides sp. PF5-9]MDH6356602.1 TonB-linked SusC/RagA family outer membrane protein [Parabacteroides sp. PF5-9]
MREKCKTFSLCKPIRLAQMMLVATFLLINCLPVMAQSSVKVSGVVSSETDGYPLIGVNVVQKGTTNGSITDIDGKYEITVPVGAQLEFSYIGFLSQAVNVVSGNTIYSVMLREDSQSLDEVVVVGYGVQKKKLITGATVQVSGDNIQKMSTTSAFTALQGQTPGVNIMQSSGQPGEGFKVTIRGLGTAGNSSPLYVIDGVSGGDINHLNPSDIESIDVLKDAASAAIYGARAANGVILVTTKQGKAGKMTLSYDGYVGVQNVYKMPSLLNAKEYMTIMDERRFNEGNAGYDWANLLPASIYEGIQNGTWNGTNWMEEIRNENAMTQNHAINLIGGSETSKFSMGFSYTGQEGILGGPAQSQWDRYTARVNSEHILHKANGFNVVTIGQNLLYNYREKEGIAVGNIYWNDVHNMIVANPLLPVYDSDGNYYDQNDKEREGWLYDGGTANPIGDMMYSSRGQNLSKSYSLRANAYIEIQPILNLKFKSVFGYNMSSSSYRSYAQAHKLSTTVQRTEDEVTQNAGSGYDISWENTLAYSFKLNNDHAFDVMIGQSILKWGMGEELEGYAKKPIFTGNFDYAWLSNTKPTEMTDFNINYGRPWGEGALASFFGRANYNYKETYMASFSLRSDGSSNFARGNRWGYFPAVSAGWVMTNEPFMESVHNWMDFFKLRGSWGQNGNSNIDNFQYLATVAFDESNAYYFGENKTSQTTGGYADILPNKDVTWETSEQLNIGFDARFLDSRLGVAFDWYKKTTKDWLVKAPTLASYGTGAPYINGGDIENKGVELGLNWNDYIGEFTYGVNLNFDYTKNEVTRIANSEKIIQGEPNVLSQGTSEMYRAQVGYPIGYFYGYKTEGVYQNQAQIDERRAAGNKGTLANAQPGDLIFADINGDNVIDEDDKTMIGNPNPDLTVGLSLNFGYKGFDLSVTGRGVFGHQIAKSYRSFADSPLQNYTTDVFDRWHGEGTSNKMPRLTSGSHSNYQNVSDIWIEDADFFRLQNITLGYDFKKLFPKMVLGQARLYVSAQNLFTITGYSGMDPEVGYGGDTDSATSANHGRWARGIDLGFYPSARTYLVGVNLKF